MQDFIATTGIESGSRTLPEKGALVSGQIKDFFSHLNRIDCLRDLLIYLTRIADHPAGHSQTGLDIRHSREILHLRIDKKFGYFHESLYESV